MIAMLLAAALAAGPIAAPKLTNDFITPADFPKGWVSGRNLIGQRATAYLRVSVTPAGNPVRCEVARASGLPHGFDACPLVLQRATFSPAIGTDGQPTFGATYVWFEWNDGNWRGPLTHYLLPPDQEIGVRRLPREAMLGIDVPLDLLVSETGTVEGCAAHSEAEDAALGGIACTEAGRTPVGPVKDKAGTAVRGVQTYVVNFVEH